MLRLTLDMDDVLADTHQKLVSVILSDFSTALNEQDLKSKGLRELLHPKQLQRLHQIMDSPGFFADIPVMQGAQETVRKLSDYYEVFIATACMEFPTSFSDKFNWLKRHFPFIPWTRIVFCGYKSIIHSDYLIDDQARNLAAFEGKGILFTAAHNRNEKAFTRVDNWKDVSELFLAGR